MICDLGLQIQESIRLMKIKQNLEEDRGEEVSVEMWAQAAGLSVKALERTMADGETARPALGENETHVPLGNPVVEKCDNSKDKSHQHEQACVARTLYVVHNNSCGDVHVLDKRPAHSSGSTFSLSSLNSAPFTPRQVVAFCVLLCACAVLRTLTKKKQCR